MESPPSDTQDVKTAKPHYAIDKGIASGELQSVKGKELGTFLGVYLPTTLNILGVIMYLRLGWIVGNAGLFGAIFIVLAAYFITGVTAFAISSISTNIRLGAGGIFSIASQSLGLEIGGSIGIQFYLAQSFAAAMYIYGFMESWRYLFPDDSPILVILGVYCVMVIVSFLNASLAFRFQMIVMLGSVAALASMIGGAFQFPVVSPQIFGDWEGGNFWFMFAIFFPAATDVLVGSTMSGNLKKPRWSIPVGTLAAWGTTLFVYIGLCCWYALLADPDSLKNNLSIAADRSAWNFGVAIGILASCFNAGLSSLTVGPRVLQSLGEHKIVPFPSFFGALHRGEPRNASLFTAALIAVALSVGALNALAQLVTVCFLLAYFTINTILLIESRLNMVSFRPSLKIPIWFPLLGSFACLSTILIISPFWGLLAIIFSISIYIYLNTKGLETPWETIQGGVFAGIVNWGAKKVQKSAGHFGPRSWKPDLLAPIERRTQLEGYYRLLKSLVTPQGSIQIIGFMKERNILPLIGLKQSVSDLQNEGIFASASIIEASNFKTGLETTVDVLSGTFSHPNIIFVASNERTEDELHGVLEIAQKSEMGVVFYAFYPETALGKEKKINLWVRDQSPEWRLSMELSSIDLSLLLSYKLMLNWKGHLNVISVIQDPTYVPTGREYLEELLETARIPKRYQVQAVEGNFMEYLERVPRADLNVFGMSSQIPKNTIETITQRVKSSCLFVLDSGNESALA